MPIVAFSDRSALAEQDRPTIGVYSMGSVNGSDRQFSQFQFDVNKLRDPCGQKQFYGMTGRNVEVQTWLKVDERVAAITRECLLLADDLVKPKPREDGTRTEVRPASTWLSFAFRDFHGKWIAPAMAEIVAHELSDAGYTVALFHRELKDLK